MALQELLVGISFIFIQSVVNSIGLVESAAIGVGEKVCAFLMLVASAYMQSMAAFVAQNNGAGKHERSKKTLKYGIETAFAAVLFCFIGFFNGCEKTIFVMVQGIVGAFCVRVPLVILFRSIGNGSLFLIGLATPISSIVQIILCVIAFVVIELYKKEPKL